LFPWAKFRKHKGAVTMHTLLDLHGNIPTFISITDGKVHDVKILDEIWPEAGAFYVMDRGYVDFERIPTAIDSAKAYPDAWLDDPFQAPPALAGSTARLTLKSVRFPAG
jgi:hypothetical protein